MKKVCNDHAPIIITGKSELLSPDIITVAAI